MVGDGQPANVGHPLVERPAACIGTSVALARGEENMLDCLRRP
jgi:hypothetical protein